MEIRCLNRQSCRGTQSECGVTYAETSRWAWFEGQGSEAIDARGVVVGSVLDERGELAIAEGAGVGFAGAGRRRFRALWR
jgi:hypothetical protein